VLLSEWHRCHWCRSAVPILFASRSTFQERFVTEHYRHPYTKATYVHIWLFLPNCIFQVVSLLLYSKSTNYFSNSK
jgi:hypothetical protein